MSNYWRHVQPAKPLAILFDGSVVRLVISPESCECGSFVICLEADGLGLIGAFCWDSGVVVVSDVEPTEVQ